MTINPLNIMAIIFVALGLVYVWRCVFAYIFRDFANSPYSNPDGFDFWMAAFLSLLATAVVPMGLFIALFLYHKVHTKIHAPKFLKGWNYGQLGNRLAIEPVWTPHQEESWVEEVLTLPRRRVTYTDYDRLTDDGPDE